MPGEFLDEPETVLMVGMQSDRRLHWMEPKNLHGREASVFYHMHDGFRYVPTPPFCLISYRPRPKWVGRPRKVRGDADTITVTIADCPS